MKYLTKQGMANLLANRLMTAAGIGVLSVCLLITGAATLFTLNVDSLVAYLGNQNETVVYLSPEATDEQIGNVYDQILRVQGVESAKFISNQDVLDTYRGYLSDSPELWDVFENDNPFKSNYSVVISELDRMQEIKENLQAIEGVYSVSAPEEMSGIFVSVQHVVTVVGYLLIGVLAMVSLVVISNTIRLSVYARRKEINIMKYVGATNAFIRWPFFVEGIVVGLVASCLSLIVLFSGYAVLLFQADKITGFWETFVGDAVVPLSEVWYWMVPLFLFGGAIIGGLGSVVSVRKHLDV